MERLTKLGSVMGEEKVCCTHFDCKECNDLSGQCSDGCSWEEKAWEKLFDYEETGLTPEQVATMKTELQDERYRHDRQADFTIGQGQKIDQLKEELEAMRGSERSHTMDNEDNILRAALDTFGAEAQTKMLFEEIGELMTAICQYSRGRDKVSHLAEEIADVQIMLGQMTVLFDCEAEVERQRRYKLRRLEQRIEKVQGDG